MIPDDMLSLYPAELHMYLAAVWDSGFEAGASYVSALERDCEVPEIPVNPWKETP